MKIISVLFLFNIYFSLSISIEMGCCLSSQANEGAQANDQQLMINAANISRDPGLINSAEKSEPLLTGPDHLAFQNVVELSSGSEIDKNVLDDLMKSTSESANEEEDA